jgi:hypothetical protein
MSAANAVRSSFVLTSMLCAAALSLGCSGSSDANGNDASAPDAVSRSFVSAEAGSFPRRDARPLVPCTNSDSCADGWACHPELAYCVEQGPECTAHAQCSNATYCEPTLGRCIPSTTGSPCDNDGNCADSCTSGVCGCDGLVQQRDLSSGPLDVYFIMDRTGSMGDDCDYVAGESPPLTSKACVATYAVSDYLINVEPATETRLAFQFMSQPRDCDGTAHGKPLVPLTQLPVAVEHELIQEISDETFEGGYGTRIEGALRGLARFTAANATPGREIIGVLMTDGEPNRCEQDISDLRRIIEAHKTATGIKTYIIGMDGARERDLEQLAKAGGAEPHAQWCGDLEPPCHYWNVGDGSGNAIASALQAIVQMAAPLPCQFDVADLQPPEGQELDYGKVNVTLTDGGTTTTLGQVTSEAACPTDQPAWYYDNPSAPTQIYLCPNACTLVSEAGEGARVNAVVGCQKTVTLF